MPDNWIGHIRLTNETEIVNSQGEKIHDLIPCDQGAGVEVDKDMYPVLWEKLRLATHYKESIITSYPISEDTSNQRGFTSDGVNIWLSTATVRALYRYDLEGILLKSVSLPLNIQGLTVLGDHLYGVVASSGGDRLWEIDKNTLSTVNNYSIPGTNPSSIATDGTYLYIGCRDTSDVRKYTLSGELVEVVYPSHLGTLSYFAGEFLGNGQKILNSAWEAVGTVDAKTSRVFIRHGDGSQTLGVGGDNTITVGVLVALSYLPNMPRPEGSSHPYKIVADAT